MKVQSIIGKRALVLFLVFFAYWSYSCTPGKQTTESAVISEDLLYVVSPNLMISDEDLNECWIAVSPKNPDFLLATAQTGNMEAASLSELRHCRLFLSRDAGNLWEPVTLPGYVAGAFDPQVAADPDGRTGWSISKELGTQNCLHPKQISEPITVILGIEEKTKADAIVNFDIYGRLKK